MAADKSSDEKRKVLDDTAAVKYKPVSQPGMGGARKAPGSISGDEDREAIKQIIPQDESAQTLKHATVALTFTNDKDVLDDLSANLGYEKADLKALKATPDLIKQIDPKHAIKYRIFPVRYTDDALWVAIADPLNIQITDDLQRIYHKQIHSVVAPEDDIIRHIRHYYEGSAISDMYDKAADDAIQAETKDTEDELYTDAMLKTGPETAEPPVVKFVGLLFKQAVQDRASDIHVEPNKTGITIRFRVDGVLHEVPAPPKRWQNSVISRLKVLSGMDLAEKRVPLDGRIKLDIPGKNLDVRVSSLPTIFGESIVMRILDQASVLMGLEDVGFLEDNIRRFRTLIKSPNGVILMTGPTGSGKTTTLYSALATINHPEVKIVTVEDPVEYMLDGVNQVHVNKEIGLDFAYALRSILRQSPDVIMVGEMRDTETAEIGIRAALTGHLVFSTLHTNDAPSACIRLIDMGIKPFLVASSIQAVIAQRLVRRICSTCRDTYKPKPDEIASAGHDPDEMADTPFYKGKGCDRCSHSGYRGRIAIHEMFIMDPDIRHMVIRSESANKLKKVGIEKGMRTLRMDGWQKVLLGHTTIPEVMRVTAADEW
ncbi:MAG: ATPase, T2SS/T4P/T4SS family [bacterium]|nr:ATPase, T2SS/T4P/T4SS family [Candidatus Sumerlaeota bacterium]